MNILKYIPKEKSKSKSSILEILPLWYILSLKSKGKGDCKKKYPFWFSLMSLYIFNLDDEFGLLISTDWIKILLGEWPLFLNMAIQKSRLNIL